MGNRELIKNLSDRTGLTKDTCRKFIEIMADEIVDKLLIGETVTIRGFMSFEPVIRGERRSRDLNTGEEVVYPPVKTVNCKLSKTIKELLNERDI